MDRRAAGRRSWPDPQRDRKLLLYKTGDDGKTVTMDDALAVLGDTAAIGIDDVVGATFDGNVEALDRALDRVFAEGGNPVQLVRACSAMSTSSMWCRGMSPPAAISKRRCQGARLPRGGPVRQRFERHARAGPCRG